MGEKYSESQMPDWGTFLSVYVELQESFNNMMSQQSKFDLEIHESSAVIGENILRPPNPGPGDRATPSPPIGAGDKCYINDQISISEEKNWITSTPKSNDTRKKESSSPAIEFTGESDCHFKRRAMSLKETLKEKKQIRVLQTICHTDNPPILPSLRKTLPNQGWRLCSDAQNFGSLTEIAGKGVEVSLKKFSAAHALANRKSNCIRPNYIRSSTDSEFVQYQKPKVYNSEKTRPYEISPKEDVIKEAKKVSNQSDICIHSPLHQQSTGSPDGSVSLIGGQLGKKKSPIFRSRFS